MKISAAAGTLAQPLALAAALVQDKIVKKIPALGAVRLVAGENTVAVSLCNLDAHLTLSIPAETIGLGELAVSAERLAGLTAGFAKDATVTMAMENTVAVIKSGRSCSRLATFPLTELPTLALTDEIGRVAISHADACRLFARVAFAISKEETRYYLNGLYLHALDGGIAAVATDGHRLARTVINGVGELSQDSRCIIPSPTVKVTSKLLATHRDLNEVVLRRSATLIEIAGGPFRLVSRLVDATYPDYVRAVGANDGSNVVVVNRDELAAAIGRIGAVVADAVVALAWGRDLDGLHLCAAGHGDAAQDAVAVVRMRGAARIAFTARYGLDLLDALDSDTVAIDDGDTVGGPVWVTGDQGANELLIVQMQHRGPAREAAA